MIKNQLWPKFKMLDTMMADLSVDLADCEIFFFFPFFLIIISPSSTPPKFFSTSLFLQIYSLSICL